MENTKKNKEVLIIRYNGYSKNLIKKSKDAENAYIYIYIYICVCVCVCVCVCGVYIFVY